MKNEQQNSNKLFMTLDTNEGIKFVSKTSISLIEEIDSRIHGYRLGITLKEKRLDGQHIYFMINPEALTDIEDQLKDFNI